jgi:hypothetical protein
VTKEALETLIRHLELGALVFGALVVIGVAGETIFGVRIWWNNRKLQKIQQSENTELQIKISGLQQKTAEADAKAEGFRFQIAEANTRVKSAEAQVASANAASQEAVAKVANAEARIAEAQRGAAEANLSAERERMARLQLEARLADRMLSPAQQATMTERLKAWSGVTVDAIIWGDTAEIMIISNQVLEVMRRAGWIIQLGHAGGGGGAVRGILVGTSPDANANDIAASAALVPALQSVGLAAGSWKFAEMQQPMVMLNTSFTGKAPIRVFIGSKP